MSLLKTIASWFGSGPVETQKTSISEDQLNQLSRILKKNLTRPFLFEQALSHRSYLRVNKLSSTNSYERLEFLGDGLVNMIVAEHLYRNFPDEDEGFLTKLRARLVNGKTLATLCRETGLSELILFGPDIEESEIKDNEGIQADIFESVCGALFIQSGFDEVRRFVLSSVKAYVNVEELAVTSDNYKSDLLEYLQSLGKEQPIYKVVKETGPPHRRNFEIEVVVDGKAFGKGIGKSKKVAEQKAAFEALAVLNS